jgi:transcriptional regulator CtsR
VPGKSVGNPEETTVGVVVTADVPFAKESFEEIPALAPDRLPPVRVNRAIPYHRSPWRSLAGVYGSAHALAPAPGSALSDAPVNPSAPVLDSSFAGLGNPPRSQGDVIPPDTMGAVGPNHLVSLLNSDFGVFDKTTGAVLQKISLQSFWASLGTATGQPANFPFDPKVFYDPSSDRFFAVTLGGPNSPNSWILVAVSSTSDPTGAWRKWAIDADRDNNTQQFNNWADFPGVGLDPNNLYVCANMFSNGDAFQYGKIWVIPKPQLLSGGASLTWTEFRDPPGSSFSMQPAYTFGAAPAEYFLFEGSSSLLLMARIDNTSGTPVWHAPTAVTIAAYTVSDLLAGAPQSGNDNTIDTADTRFLNVVYRNGSLWTVHTVPSPATTKTEVAWYQIDTGTATILSQGRISDSARWYYYPSIAVNKDNIAAVGFSGSSTTEFAGGYYTLIQPSSGTAEPVALLKAGEAPYSKTFYGTDNRWGDYSATIVDPSDDTSFWTLQEYAQTPDPATGASRWGTWWGKFHPPDSLPPTAPANLSAAAASSSQINLTWTDQSTNETSFQIERKTGAGGTYAQIGTAAANATAYSDSGIAEGTTYFYRVRAVNAAGNSAYSNEASATTPVSPPAAPANLSAAAVSSSQINLAWTDQSTNETGFQIERKTGAGGTYAQIGTAAANAAAHSDNGVAEGTTYFYRVRAANAAGNSAYSNEASATTPVSPPAAPANLSATPVSSSQINLAWTDQSTNETGFQIERKTGAGGTYAQIGTAAANAAAYSDNGVAEGTTYFYRVRAANAAGNSAYSNEASATTPSSGTGGGGGGGGCSISPEGKSRGESTLGTMLALFSPGIFLVVRRTIHRKQIYCRRKE